MTWQFSILSFRFQFRDRMKCVERVGWRNKKKRKNGMWMPALAHNIQNCRQWISATVWSCPLSVLDIMKFAQNTKAFSDSIFKMKAATFLRLPDCSQYMHTKCVLARTHPVIFRWRCGCCCSKLSSDGISWCLSLQPTAKKCIITTL